MESRLRSAVNDDEVVVWQGKPQRGCFILESIFNPMLPFALLWAAIDITILLVTMHSEAAGEMQFMIIPFLLLHMMPVWIYLFGVIFSALRLSRIEYIITDAGVYISGGLFSYSYEFKPFAELDTVVMHRGIFDQVCKCGDVVFNRASATSTTTQNGQVKKFAIINIPDYEEVYKMVKRMQRDIHSDTMFPNEYRPGTNSGYHTEYDPQNFKK